MDSVIIENSDDKIGQRNVYWTNEKHFNFLNLMEANFVRNMFEKSVETIDDDDRFVHNHLRLDRFVPDISESTRDLQGRRNTGSVNVSDLMTRTGSKRRKRSPTHPSKISRDQVVPQLDDRAGDDKGEKDHHIKQVI